MKVHFHMLLILAAFHCELTAAQPTYDTSINKVRADPTSENILELAGHLRGTARYNQPPESSPSFLKLQQSLVSIPGHARIIAEEVERMRKEVEHLTRATGGRQDYDRWRNWYLSHTLMHLPSPETVGVLGSYLSDESDKPPPPLPGQDYMDIPSNALLAVTALHHLGLRNPPENKNRFWDENLALIAYRVWWEEVKSGKRAFSFKGQKVEYRFKPDGTWETITMANPPDDGPGRAEAGAAKRPTRRPEAAVSETETPSSGMQWPWILVVTILLLGGVSWRSMMSRNA